MKYLAIDYGEKRIGLAICDDSETIASPLTVIKGPPGVIEKIRRTVEDEKIEAIILGLPLNMDDSEGPQAKLVRKFAAKLKKHIDIPIYFHDERLSSFDAQEKLTAAGFTRKKKKKHLDALAAAAILQSFLDEKDKP